MGHPLFSITILHLRGSESTSFVNSSGEITLNQAAITYLISSLFVLGLFLEIMQLILYHKFSIGFKSGGWAGHSILSTWWDSYHFWTFLARWHGALSSWKIHWLSENNERALGNIFLSSTSIYFVPFIIPDTTSSLPTPFAAMHPHTMMDCGCLMVGEMQYGRYCSLGRLFT